MESLVPPELTLLKMSTTTSTVLSVPVTSSMCTSWLATWPIRFMTSETLRLKSPSELLAIVPYLLGFTPSDSIMVISLKNNTVGLTQRLDLPKHGAGEAAARSLMPALLREPPDPVLLIAYESQPDRSAETIGALTSVLAAASIPIHDRIVVHHGHWRSLDCSEPWCCPLEGQPVPTAAEAPALVSAFVGREPSPYASRDSFMAQLEAREDCLTDKEIETALALDRGDVIGVWPQILDTGDSAAEITPAMAASAAVSLQDVHLRDGLVAWLTPDTLDLADLPEEVQSLFSQLNREWGQDRPDTAAIVAMNRIQARLVRLCTMLPDEHAAPALTVLACFSWWRGNGALTRAALGRALRSEPDYRLARLLQRMVDLAIRPRPTP